jgi:transposase
MPEANTFTMQEFLNQFAKTLPKNEIAAMFVDQAGWHASNDLVPPENLVLLPLPAYWPELNPIERVWLFLKERYLSHRLLDDYDSIVDAACAAWNRLTAEKSLCSYPWIERMMAAAIKT